MFTKNFTASLLLTLLFSNHTCLCMHVESYWESWVLKDYPDDWCALLKEVPASPVGSKEGSNYICIGRHSWKFDITFGTNLERMRVSMTFSITSMNAVPH